MCKNKRKFILISTNEPLEIGDVICNEKHESHTFGSIKIKIEETLLPSNVDRLIKEGVIKEVTDNIDMDIDKCVKILSSKLEMKLKDATTLLERMNNVAPSVVTRLLIKILANEFNNKRQLQEKAYIVTTKGNIVPEDKVEVFKNPEFTWFLSEEDAIKARDILKPQIDYARGKK